MIQSYKCKHMDSNGKVEYTDIRLLVACDKCKHVLYEYDTHRYAYTREIERFKTMKPLLDEMKKEQWTVINIDGTNEHYCLNCKEIARNKDTEHKAEVLMKAKIELEQFKTERRQRWKNRIKHCWLYKILFEW